MKRKKQIRDRINAKRGQRKQHSRKLRQFRMDRDANRINQAALRKKTAEERATEEKEIAQILDSLNPTEAAGNDIDAAEFDADDKEMDAFSMGADELDDSLDVGVTHAEREELDIPNLGPATGDTEELDIDAPEADDKESDQSPQ